MELRKRWCFEVLVRILGLQGPQNKRIHRRGSPLNGGVGESVKDTPPPAGKSKDTGKVYETARIG